MEFYIFRVESGDGRGVKRLSRCSRHGNQIIRLSVIYAVRAGPGGRCHCHHIRGLGSCIIQCPHPPTLALNPSFPSLSILLPIIRLTPVIDPTSCSGPSTDHPLGTQSTNGSRGSHPPNAGKPMVSSTLPPGPPPLAQNGT